MWFYIIIAYLVVGYLCCSLFLYNDNRIVDGTRYWCVAANSTTVQRNTLQVVVAIYRHDA